MQAVEQTKYFTNEDTINNTTFDELASAIAEALGWVFIEHRIANLYYGCNRIIKDQSGKYAINIKLDPGQKNKQNPKVEISWQLHEIIKSLPHKRGEYLINYIDKDYRNKLKINVSANRHPDQIAKDISRRLIKPSQSIVDAAIDTHLSCVNLQHKTRKITQELAETLGVPLLDENQSEVFKFIKSVKPTKTWNIVSISAEVSDDESVNLSLNNLSPSIAKQVLELVNANYNS